MMTRIIIGLAVGGFLNILNTYPAYSRFLSKLENLKSRNRISTMLIDIADEAGALKKDGPLIKPISEALTFSRFEKGG